MFFNFSKNKLFNHELVNKVIYKDIFLIFKVSDGFLQKLKTINIIAGNIKLVLNIKL